MSSPKDQIITLPNPNLRLKSQRIGLITDEVRAVIQSMKDATLDWEASREHEVGVALAAIQIDKPLRIVVIRNDFDNKEDKTFSVLINPEITKLEGEIQDDYEGCLSIKDIYGQVPRYSKIRLRALDENGHERRFKAEGFLARVIQHEVDHVNGKMFIDHIENTPEAFYTLKENGKLEKLDMRKSNKLVFFGNERLASGLNSTDAPILNMLIKSGYEIAAVVSNYTEGRSRNARKLEIAEVAKHHNIPLLLPDKLTDIKEELQNYNAVAAILVAYGRIIPKDIIDIFPCGIINIHPSLLPKYRGPTPIEQAILDGVSETGVSIMQLTTQMDTGPIFAQAKISLQGNESKAELAKKLLELGGGLLQQHLPAVIKGSTPPISQDDSKATYTKLLNKDDGRINWKEPADVIERQIRAFLGHPKSQANIFGHSAVITKARVAKNEEDGSLIMKCQPGWLEILELTAPSGRTISGAEFLRGYTKN